MGTSEAETRGGSRDVYHMNMRQILFLMLACALGFAQPRPAQKKATTPGSAASQATPAGRWPIASLAIEGNRIFNREQVLALAKLRVGQTAGKADFEAARDRLLASGAFETVGYKFVQAPNGEGYAATLQLTEVEQVYPVDFQDLHVSSLDLDAALRAKDPIYSREGLPATQPVLERYKRWIEEYLKAKGIEEKIAGSVQPAFDGGYNVVFRPDRPLPAVAQVTFEGNQVIPEDKLREAIAGAVGAPYTEDVFRQILTAAIRPLYEDKGFVRVAFPELRIQPAADVKGVHVFVQVNEGVSYELGKVVMDGPTPLPAAALIKAGEFKGGDVNVREHITEGLERIKKEVRRAGYLDAQVFSDRKVDDGKHVVNVAVRVDAGPMYHMGRLTINGLDLSGEAEMKRIWTMAEGKPFNPEYPDLFLKRVREGGMFDGLGLTKADVVVDQKAHTADVTLNFKGAPPVTEKKRGGRGGWGPGGFTQ
jgi:outer membrane protein insertion porin family